MSAYRKATQAGPRRPQSRFGAKETVSGAAAQRAGGRLAALEKDGIKVKGVDGTDGYNGQEIRRVKAARAKQKDSRTKAGTVAPPRRNDEAATQLEAKANELRAQLGAKGTADKKAGKPRPRGGRRRNDSQMRVQY